LSYYHEHLFISNFTASSSSVYGSNEDHGPHLAIDGRISDTDNDFFHSESERYPWFQVKLESEKTISSVTIVNRKDSNGWRLADIEVRAGMTEVKHLFHNARIEVNPVCGTFEGPGEDGKTYSITCKTPVKAKYVTVQIVPNVEFPKTVPESILQINELTFNEDKA
jgi:hypothetical protein